MKSRSTFFVWAIILAIAHPCMSQISIYGKVQSGGASVPFANLLLLSGSDSSLVKGTVADASGHFSLSTTAQGKHLIKISYIGYEDLFSAISLNNQDIDLGIIKIDESAEQLEDVVIEAQKPLFEQKIDRTIVNVQSSITTSAGSALDVLEKSPGVTVNRANNSIALAGKNGVHVMINGKMSRMPLSAAVQMLNGMNAENVERIELITTPPAKYEAEGNAGIINIILKKTEDDGTNGSFSTFVGYGDREKFGSSANFNHRKKKLNLFGNASLRYDHTKQFNRNDRVILDENNVETVTLTQSFRDPVTKTYNGQIGFDYQLDDPTIIGSNISFFHSGWEMDADNVTDVSIADQPSSHLDMFNHEINNTTYLVGNINISHDIDDKNNISAEIDYINFDSYNPTDYDQDFEDLDGTNSEVDAGQIESSKKTPIHTWVPRIDYTWKINDQTTFEAGAKAVLNNLENDVSVVYIYDGETTIDPELTRKVSMTEDIWAAYTTVNFKLSSKVDAKIGIRYEHTSTDLDTRTEQNVVKRYYGQWFPSLFLNKKINDNRSWVLSYSRRVTRPTFRDIAPFVIFLDPNTFWTGNESLYPSITNALRAEYRYKTYLFSLQYSRDEDAIFSFQPRIAEDGETQLTSSENMDFTDNYSVSFTLPFEVTDWWEMQYNITGIYNITQSSQLDTKVKLETTILTANGSSTFKLPKGFTFEISGFYRSASYFGITKYDAFGMLNFGLEKGLDNNGGSFRLSYSDVFRGRRFLGSTEVPEENLDVVNEFRLEGAIWQLSYTKNFGNNQLKKMRNKQSSSQEEQRRIQ